MSSSASVRNRRSLPGRRWLAAWLALQVAALGANLESPTVITGGSFPSASASGGSGGPVLTGDGRFVVFVSAADNLVTNDHNGAVDVFRRDRATGRTLLVSVSADGARSGSAASWSPRISADGRFVAFQSLATNLVAGATHGVDQVLLRDVTAGTTALVSVGTNGLAGNGPAFNPQMTPDGRFVVFESHASDLVDGDANAAGDVFVRDLVTGTTRLVSVTASGIGSGAGYSYNGSITPDGRFVVFESTAADLAAGDSGQTSDVFRRDLQTGTTVLVSVGRDGLAAGGAQNGVMNDSGRFVAFGSTSHELVAGDVESVSDIFLRDLESGTTILVSPGSTFDAATNAPAQPRLSRDGRWVVFQSGAAQRLAVSRAGQVYAWDTVASRLVLVSVGADGSTPGAGVSYAPESSGDGRFVTFLSTATNLVADATNSVAQVYQYDLESGRMVLVTRDPAGQPANADSAAASAGDDGRIVAFETLADNLVEADRNGVADVVVQDLGAESSELISLEDAPAATAPGLSLVAPGALSADGRYVVFTSLAAGLVPGDRNGTFDVFRRDLWTGSNLLVSVNTNGSAANGASRDPSLSADGRFVVFGSGATDLTRGVAVSRMQVYLRDLDAMTTVLVSAGWGGQAGNAAARGAGLSADGRWVVFESAATDLVPNHSDKFADIFLYDRLAGTNRLASVRGSVVPPVVDQRAPLIGADGRFVVWLATPTGTAQLYARDLAADQTFLVSVDSRSRRNWVGPGSQVLSQDGRYLAYVGGSNVFRFDLVARTNELVAPAGANARLSGDGQWVAFEQPVYDSSVPPRKTNTAVAVWGARQRAVLLASPNQDHTGPGNGSARGPVVSADGRFVLFTSRATDLSPLDRDAVTDLFVRDLLLGRTWLISTHPTTGAASLGISAAPVFAPDGRTVVFQSYASDLADHDVNGTADLFALRIVVADTDRDGLDDDWEMACFDTLERDGTGDFDGDGQTDLAEFKAGTQPTRQASVLRGFNVASLVEGTTTVFWEATPGRTYQVQARDKVESGSWTALPGSVLASDAIAAYSEATSAGAAPRFYRILLVGP